MNNFLVRLLELASGDTEKLSVHNGILPYFNSLYKYSVTSMLYQFKK